MVVTFRPLVLAPLIDAHLDNYQRLDWIGSPRTNVFTKGNFCTPRVVARPGVGNVRLTVLLLVVRSPQEKGHQVTPGE